MPNRLRYERADGTAQYSLIYGLLADRPVATATPAGAHYFASDTGQLFVCTGTIWGTAADNDPPPNARTGVLGQVKVHRNASGSHPKVLTTDDLGAANGVAQLNGSGGLTASVLPIAGANLGGIKQGSGIIIDADGLAHIPSGGSGSFEVQHNHTTVATRAIIDFLTNAGISYAVVHDAVHNKITITPTNYAGLVLLQPTAGGAAHVSGAWTDIYSTTVGVGTWVPFGAWYGSAGVGGGDATCSFRVSDGTNTYGSGQFFYDQTSSGFADVFLSAFEPIVVLSGTLTVHFQMRPNNQQFFDGGIAGYPVIRFLMLRAEP